MRWGMLSLVHGLARESLYQRSTDCAADVSMRYLPSLRRYAYVRLYGLWLEREPVSRAGLLGCGKSACHRHRALNP
jgi:hypothetical protein